MTGILLVDKPADWTSSDVVCKLRGVLHERKIGHSGTLDPMATGLLPVFLGRATKAVEFAESQEKRYIAGLRIGLVTDTQDIWGNELSRSDGVVPIEDFLAVCRTFTGEIEQIPPMYSAIKVNGKKLYELARRGETVERKARQVTIKRIEVLQVEENGLLLDVVCSKGTYIRTLCHDIGQALGTGACMSSLRRIGCGPFSIDDAVPLEDLIREQDPEPAELHLIPIDALFAGLPSYVCTAEEEKRIRNGLPVPTERTGGDCRVYAPGGDFLMLGRVENRLLSSRKNFF